MRCDITIPRPAPAVRHLQYSRHFGRDRLSACTCSSPHPPQIPAPIFRELGRLGAVGFSRKALCCTDPSPALASLRSGSVFGLEGRGRLVEQSILANPKPGAFRNSLLFKGLLAQAAIQLCIGFVPHPKVSRQSAEDADVSEALRTTSAVCPLLHFERTPRLLQSLQRIRRFLRHRLLLP